MCDEEWEQLASTALTIGSPALDKIEKKLTLLSAKHAWTQGFDYRPIATQIHTIAGPARKTINSLNFRSKCVRAVLKVQSTQNATEAIAELQNRMISNLEDVIKWQADSVAAFENEKSVNPSFRSNYVKEWIDFCGEWNSAKIEMKHKSERSLESIFENSLMLLTQESKKSKIQWEPVLRSSGKISRPDGIMTSGFPFDLKRQPGQLTIVISIPKLTDSELHNTAVDLMDVIENVTGLVTVEIGFNGAKDPNILEVIFFESYTTEQLKLALSGIDTYLKEHFSHRT